MIFRPAPNGDGTWSLVLDFDLTNRLTVISDLTDVHITMRLVNLLNGGPGVESGLDPQKYTWAGVTGAPVAPAVLK